MHYGSEAVGASLCPSATLAFAPHPSEVIARPVQVTPEVFVDQLITDTLLRQLDCDIFSVSEALAEYWKELTPHSERVEISIGRYGMLGAISECDTDLVDCNSLKLVEKRHPGQGRAILNKLCRSAVHCWTPSMADHKLKNTPDWAQSYHSPVPVVLPDYKVVNELPKWSSGSLDEGFMAWPMFIYHMHWDEDETSPHNAWHEINSIYLYMCEGGEDPLCWKSTKFGLQYLHRLAKTLNILAELNEVIKNE